MRTSTACLLAAGAVAAFVTASSSSAPVRVGGEFQVNTYTTNAQGSPRVEMDASGDFAVVWDSVQDGSSIGIFGKRYDSSGNTLAGEFQINKYTTGAQKNPAMAMAPDGDFVVVWESEYQDGGEFGTFGRRVRRDTGVLAGNEFQVNSYSGGSQVYPAAGMQDDGSFVVAWENGNEIIAARFDSLNVDVGVEFVVNAHTTNSQFRPDVAVDSNGDFVATWISTAQDGSLNGVFAQRFSSTGVRLGAEFQANSYTTGNQQIPAIGVESNGDFVIAWESYGQDGSFGGIFGKRFNSSGQALAVEFQVSVRTLGSVNFVDIDLDEDGDFVVVWSSSYGGQLDVFARRFDSSGIALGGDFRVNTYTLNDQSVPKVTMGGDDDFVVVWQSNFQDGALGGVFAQRFENLAVLDVDGNGVLAPLTDGLLILRHLFGFTGTVLSSGAIGPNCKRCTGAAVTSYLTGLGMRLDADQNMDLKPLTDGILALRFLFGFTGSELIVGAVGPGCMDCDAPSIEAYLGGLE